VYTRCAPTVCQIWNLNSQVALQILNALMDLKTKTFAVGFGKEKKWCSPNWREFVVSDTKAQRFATEIDLMMMLTLGGAERTEKQWRALIDDVGLKIKEIFTYSKDTTDSIILLVLK